MRVKLLGSSAGGGAPQWNCACPLCKAVRGGRLQRRRTASLAICGDDGRWLLVNAGPEIGSQLLESHLWPRARRQAPIRALLLTDANVDHTVGVLEFRQARQMPLYSTACVKRTLEASRMFAQFERRGWKWCVFDCDTGCSAVDVSETPLLRVRAIAVPGLVPGFAGGKRRSGAAVAYSIQDARARIVYAPIFLALEDPLIEQLDGADAVFLDGTCWSNDEMSSLGVGTRTARAMGHAPISGQRGTLSRARRIRARRRYLVHVNNTNPILHPSSPQRRAVERAGLVLPDDGLELAL